MKNCSATMIAKLNRQLPEGTPVRVQQESRTGRGVFGTSETFGTVVTWRHEPTGAWYAQNGDPNTPNAGGKLQLLRLSLRKLDGEITDLVIDDLTSIAKLKAKQVE